MCALFLDSAADLTILCVTCNVKPTATLSRTGRKFLEMNDTTQPKLIDRVLAFFGLVRASVSKLREEISLENARKSASLKLQSEQRITTRLQMQYLAADAALDERDEFLKTQPAFFNSRLLALHARADQLLAA